VETQQKLPPVREAVGIFFDADHLQAAIDDLLSAGFVHHDLGLLAGEHTVRESLGHLYSDANQATGDPDAPRIAFVRKGSIGDALHAWLGSLFFAGATTAAGAAVASAAVLGGSLLAAATGAATIGGIGAALALIIRENDAEYLEQQVDEGHLLLFVRTRDPAREKQATEILARHSAYDPRVHSVPDRLAPAANVRSRP
jgi:hypothetical protein